MGPDKPRATSWSVVGLLGGLGGAINAWLCYAQLPEPIMGPEVFEQRKPMDFDVTVIPGGAVHGAILAMVSVAAARRLAPRTPLVRWLAAPLVGWVAGWWSWAVLGLSMNLEDGVSLSDVWEMLIWPFSQADGLEAIQGGFLHFGLVAGCYYVLLGACRQIASARLTAHLLMGIASGVFGSLWWWCRYHPGYYSVLHGTIWGALTGYGVWRSQRRPVAHT